MQLVHCNNLYEEFETNTVFSVNMSVPVYKKGYIFWVQVRCVDIIYIDFFSLFHYYLIKGQNN